MSHSVTPPTDIWPALEKIMEIPGFTEDLVDDRPPNVPDSPDHPLYPTSSGADGVVGVVDAGGVTVLVGNPGRMRFMRIRYARVIFVT